MSLRAAVAAALAACAAAVYNGSGSVYYQAGKWVYKPIYDGSAVATGSYVDMTLRPVSGFGDLTITTNAAFSDVQQMYAAGYLEGVLTQERIKEMYDNNHAWIMSNFPGQAELPATFQQWFEQQDAWARAQISSNSSALWQTFNGVLQQFDGLQAGYNSVAPAADALTPFQFAQLGAIGDFLDLIPALTPSFGPQWHTMTPGQIKDKVAKTTHCSALVKVTGDMSELFFAHVAWFTYSTTIRIFKNYNFAGLQSSAVVGKQMSFSSYPGYLSSLDDWYAIWDSGLAVLETTNSIFNMSLYAAVKPQSLLSWHRVRVANLMASTGMEWGAIFSEYNSGTYNNQYPVVDVGRFKPGTALAEGTMVVVEQIPGLVLYEDVTQELERGYWPSYNVPYFRTIYEMSGYDTIRAAHNYSEELSGLDYQMAPRAQIFRRDQGTVTDMDSFQAIMRYNDYTHDPIAKGDPWSAICSRGDLAPQNASPDGCLDGKVSMASWWADRKAAVINGPTTSHGLPPFSWSQFPTKPHEGLPQLYNYSFEIKTTQW